jgi:hypothetical protein
MVGLPDTVWLRRLSTVNKTVFGEMYTLGIIGRESDGDEAKNDLVGTGRRSSKEWSQ